MPELDFITRIHQGTKRNYLDRVLGADKAECAAIAKKFDKEYWDGDRKYGYGGHQYDGRWRPVAEAMAKHYGLKSGDEILDVGCGKGFLLYELTQVVPGARIRGLDISKYAIENAKAEVKPFLETGNATDLPYADRRFDLVLSINTLHNLQLPQLVKALGEMERVASRGKFLVVDAYRNEREKVNLMYWQLTCECFFTPAEWQWIFQQSGYTGDYGFVCFE